VLDDVINRGIIVNNIIPIPINMGSDANVKNIRFKIFANGVPKAFGKK
jgi:hypothetical protein